MTRIRRVTSATVAMMILGAFVVGPTLTLGAAWPNQGGNEGRNGLTPENGPATAVLAWSGARSSLIAWAPFTEGNRMFTVRQAKWPYQQPDDAYVVAMNLTTGQEEWAVVLPYVSGDWTPWIAGVRDGKVYCSRSGNGASVSAKMYALDAGDGHTVWISEDFQNGGPYDGVVFAPDGDLLVASFQDIWRIDAVDGHTVWRASRVGSVSGTCGGARFGNGLYVLDAVGGGHALKKFDVETGAFLYQSPTMPGFLCQVTPWVAPDGSVLINRAENSASNDFYYSWKDNGTAFVLNWQVGGFAGAFAEHAVGPDGSVYAIITGNRFARLDGATGTILNSIAVPTGFNALHLAIDAAGRVFFSNGAFSTGHVYVYSADLQQLLWEVTVPNINIGGPAIGQNGSLVLCGVGTNLRVYRATDPTAMPEEEYEEGGDARLLAAAPNPFHGETRIAYRLPVTGRARLGIYDLAGREVRLLASGEAAARSGVVWWDGTDEEGRSLPSGVYWYRLTGEGVDERGRVVLTR